jgi:hypothetical protein
MGGMGGGGGGLWKTNDANVINAFEKHRKDVNTWSNLVELGHNRVVAQSL